MADFIYGELNDAVLSIDYEGKATDTADVSVDPSKRTVSVDVRKVPCALSVQTQSGLVSYDGSRPVSLTLGAYELREVGSTGNFRNYGLFQSGTEGALGVTIGVPSSKNLLSAEVLSCEEDGVPVEGLKAGDLYARFTCASRDGMAQENYFVYMPLNGITEVADGLVDAERSRAEKAEEALRSSIAEESSARESADGALRSSIADEASARQEADSSLEGKTEHLEGKTKHMSAGDSYTDFYETVTFKGNVNVDGTLSNPGISDISASIASVESSLTNERVARESKDTALSDRIDSEAAAREDADDLLQEGIDEAQENIASEATAREEKDKALQAASDANAKALADEAEARENEDSSLSSRIDTEVARAMGAETSLSTDLGTEIAERKSADASLTGEIAKKQDLLVSGSNIKTVNGQSLLGEGNLDVSGGLAVDAYTKEQSDARYAQKTAEVLSNGAVTSIGYGQIEPYAFVIMHGYKNNVGAPNQLTFVLVPKWLTDGESNLLVPGMATATNWNYGIVFTRNGDTVSWETDVDYGGDRQFLVTNILGVH